MTRGPESWRSGGTSLAVLVLVALVAVPQCRAGAAGEAVDPGRPEARELLAVDIARGDAWYARSFQSLFGRDDPDSTEASRGEAARIDAAFASYAGLRVRHVWVVGREAFGAVVADSTAAPEGSPAAGLKTVASPVGRLLNGLTSQTRERTVRKFLRFQEGSLIDPFAFGDSERLLRGQSFISDARIVVLPLADEPGRADVVVLVRDRWPLGVDLKVKTSARSDVEVFHRNVGGIGLGLEYELPIDTRKSPSVGHRFRASLKNVSGSFADADLQYQTRWDFDAWTANLQRNLVHPDIRIVGGMRFESRRDKDRDELPEDESLAWRTLDPWVGWSIGLDPGAERRGRRVRLVPAVRVTAVDYRSPPRSFAESEDDWRDAVRYLGQVSLGASEYYTARLVYDYGETEDLVAGYWLGLTGGLDTTELARRGYMGLRAGRSRFDPGQGMQAIGAALGGFSSGGRVEDGVFSLYWGGFGPLRRLGGGYVRNFRLLSYTRGINRTVPGGLRLDEVALRDLDALEVAGDHRVTAELESVMFTAYSLLGFRAALFGYAAGGFIGDPDSSLLEERFSMNLGAGVRLNNPRLVIPTIEFRVGLVSTSAGSEFVTSVRMGDGFSLRRDLPSSRPEVVQYR